ncbi:MAG: nucleotidyltransferase [Bacteroidales bacterium]|nr:nucleotidyltransferase [Bacteroidales bacterium]MBD5220221.1 nucleotidyltransferase [Bacteroidales bacterium]MDE6436902.1 nucleotidyltransferase domain-containing protein [Muribaculaceae bacterium]
MNLVEINLQKIIELCQRFHVRKLWVFGSILTSSFNNESDVDFCVDFKWEQIPLLDSANNFFNFQFSLEEILNRPVDLVDDSVVKNPYFRAELNETRRLIYG